MLVFGCDMERKLATLRIIDDVVKHPGADSLDLVTVGGWQMVSKLGTFKPGDRAMYFEIDSFVPVDHPAFAFLEKNAIKWNDRVGARIKTIKLRGEVSQGLIIPISEFPELYGTIDGVPELVDFAIALGVEKWERPVSPQLAGRIKGNFPGFLRKTDQERIQNLWGRFGLKDELRRSEYSHPETGEIVVVERPPRYIRDTMYEVTVKLDGSSMSAYNRDGEFGVCSRNLDLAETEGNTFWQVARKLHLRERLASLGGNYALQGELVGPGIQDNTDKLSVPEFYLFDVFNIKTGKYLSSFARNEMLALMNDAVHGIPAIQQVPCLDHRHFDFATIAEALAYADGPSLNTAVKREGVVFKSVEDPDFSFKIISNSYLLKHGG